MLQQAVGKTGSLEVRLDPRRLVLMSATVDATQFCHLVTLTSQSARMLWKFQWLAQRTLDNLTFLKFASSFWLFGSFNVRLRLWGESLEQKTTQCQEINTLVKYTWWTSRMVSGGILQLYLEDSVTMFALFFIGIQQRNSRKTLHETQPSNTWHFSSCIPRNYNFQSLHFLSCKPCWRIACYLSCSCFAPLAARLYPPHKTSEKLLTPDPSKCRVKNTWHMPCVKLLNKVYAVSQLSPPMCFLRSYSPSFKFKKIIWRGSPIHAFSLVHWSIFFRLLCVDANLQAAALRLLLSKPPVNRRNSNDIWDEQD